MLLKRLLFFILPCTLFFTALKVQAKETGTVHPLRDKTIALDPGHGGNDHGYCDKNNVCEKDITMDIAEKLAASLKKSGAQVYITREKKHFRWFPWSVRESELSLDDRIKMAESKKADIFVSIHCNASPKPHRAGAKVFYQDRSPASMLLGDQIQRELVKIPDNGKHTDKPGSYYLLNKLPIPAVVIETCYLTHRTDKEKIVNSKYREKVAKAIFSGITKYFSIQGTGDESIAGSSDNGISLGHDGREKKQAHASSPPGVSAGHGGHTTRLSGNAVLSLLKTTGAMPGDLKIEDIKLSGDQAIVDIKTPRPGYSLGGEEEYHAVYTVVNSALKISGINNILLRLNGKPADTLAGHIDISSPIAPGNPICNRIPYGTKEGKKAQVAIVIDDFGQYNTDGVKEILALDIPVTCAVMPWMENTGKHAEEAAKQGHEVIVHLPLEPVRGKKKWLGPGSITAKMSEQEVKSLVRKDFEGVPYAVGFNNHMGSAVTANDKIMRSILQVAAEKEFFVLDSRTTEETKIPVLSEEMGISCLERNVFLDNVKSVDHVKKQLLDLSREALAEGKAIGIGHVGRGGKITARAIKEMIPEMEEMGIEFVYLSEMAY
ncbi:MAG: divergent polysaccharide deacetylase family protein [Peptococcaceae bacterium]|nr:divergent polysaccharide deacetylase family protein [Peptococcaceae bacterium]